jgi:hypothetical protein
MNRFTRWVAVAAVATGATASARPLSVWVGQTQTLSIAQPVTNVEVSNETALKAKRVPGVGVSIHAAATGISTLTITCRGGTVYRFDVHMTERGAAIYLLVPTQARRP